MSRSWPGGAPPHPRQAAPGPDAPSASGSVGPPSPSPGPPLAPGALLLLLLAGAALFLAGLSLGRGAGTGSAEERAALEAFVETYDRITRDYVGEVEPRELVEGAIEGMFQRLDDPYSSYMSADQFDADLAVISGEFEGIGARMSAEDPEGRPCAPLGDGCELRVVGVLEDSPAETAGLRAGDVVTAIDGAPAAGLTMEDAITLIRGPRDSLVLLALRRGQQDLEVAIRRDVVRSQDVRSAVLADGRVGYLRVDAFTRNAAEDFRAALASLVGAGIVRVVVDVRGDPGGFVDAAVDMASQFVARGPILWEEDASGGRRAVEAVSGGVATDPAIRVAVLVDGGSASASEILAAALRDAGRAILVGETTFGKGTIQEWTQLPRDGGGFRLSVARWLTPEGTWVDGVGLEPDIVVPLPGGGARPGDEVNESTDPQVRAAVEALLGPEAVGASPSHGSVPALAAPRVSASPWASPAG